MTVLLRDDRADSGNVRSWIVCLLIDASEDQGVSRATPETPQAGTTVGGDRPFLTTAAGAAKAVRLGRVLQDANRFVIPEVQFRA